MDTGEVLDRDLMGTVDLLERDAERRLVVVDLKTAARKYSDLQAEVSLQLSVYSYAMSLGPYAGEEDIQLRFDVLTKTKQPELCRYWFGPSLPRQTVTCFPSGRSALRAARRAPRWASRARAT